MKVISNTRRYGRPFPGVRKVYTEYGVIVEESGTRYFVEDLTAEEIHEKDLDFADIERSYIFDEINPEDVWTYAD